MSKRPEEKTDEEIKVSLFRESPKVLQISKNNYYYLINRGNYDISKIMMMINNEHLSTLGEKFRDYPKGLEIIKFTSLLTNIIKTQKMSPYELTDLIYGIYKFFKEIDFNGDNNMEWAEFTQFIIDRVEGEYNNNEKEFVSANKVISEKELIKYKRYELSKAIKDLHIHKTCVISGFYFNKSNKILINEYNTHTIFIYNPLNGSIENNINIHQVIEDNSNIKFIDFQNQLKFNKKYTVINFFVTEFIIAVVLSNKYIQFFRTYNFKYNELIFNIKAKSLQKRIWYLKRHNMWISTGDKEKEEEYFYINELDISFEMKNNVIIPITDNLEYRNKYCKICKHKNEIYDVIEINNPFLILTACLDGLIRLVNVRELEYIKVWKYHPSGVKHLDYNPNLERNGYILSTGFEYNINLYCTDLSLDNVFKGKLEGHSMPLIDCKFINDTPMCASVDEDGNIRIWDTLLKICLQSIPNSKRNLTVNGLIIMGNINKFVVFGNNLTFYDSKYKEEKDSISQKHEENYPIKICYNKYYQEFFISTLNDIRIYDKYGKSDKRFKKIIDNGYFDSETKIRDFIFDNNYRKFYVGFSNGAIVQYNAGNGTEIKVINQIECERNSIIYYKYHHIQDITNLYFYFSKNDLGENINLLLSSSLDSTIQIYDERDYDTSIKLRAYKGGHTIHQKKLEILCMDFNYELSQIASGSSNGLIVIWDFENMKIDDSLYINNKIWKNKYDVLYIKYLNSYPLLFSSYSEGLCILWNIMHSSEPILKFDNFYQNIYGNIDICEVTCCLFYENVIKTFEEKYINQTYFMNNSEYNQEINLNSSKRGQKDKKKYIINEELDPFNPINNNDNLDKNYYLLVSDKKGFMKILNLKGIFNKYFKNYKNKIETSSKFNVLKKEDINAEQIIDHLLKDSINRQKSLYDTPYTNLYSSRIINREWEGHLDYITDMDFIEETTTTVTISKDKYLRIWDAKFDLIGEINVVPEEKSLSHRHINEEKVEWGFKVNDKILLEKEVHEIVDILENIELDEEIKIIKGSDLDKDLNDPEKYEIDKKKGLIKKKKKKFRKEGTKSIKKPEIDIKINNDENNLKEEIDFKSNVDSILLKNISIRIENMIKNKPQSEGMGELSNNLMSEIIETNRKKNKMMKTLKTFNTKLKEINNTKNEEQSLPSTFLSMKKTFNKSLTKSNFLFTNSLNNNDETNTKSLKSISIKIDNIKKKFCENNNFNFKMPRFKDKNYFKKEKISYNIFNNNRSGEKPLNNLDKKINIFNNYKITNNSKDFSNSKKETIFDRNNNLDFKTILLEKKNLSCHKIKKCINRYTLYTEKFFKKSLVFKRDKEREINEDILPDIKSNISRFSNEKKNYYILNLKDKNNLIRSQYNLSNYKIENNSDVFNNNHSNLLNSRNLLNNRKQFNPVIYNKQDNKNYKTLIGFRNIKKFLKSRSVIDIRSKNITNY